MPSIHLVHRRADIYPEPNEFRPERFIEAEGGRAPGTYTWIPFGGGIRRCLGAAFAQFEMEVVLQELVLRRTLAPSRPESERNYRRAITETPRRDAEVVLGHAPTTTACPVVHTPESKSQVEVEVEVEAKTEAKTKGQTEADVDDQVEAEVVLA